MKKRLTGFGAYGLSVQWETILGDEEVARRVLIFLEDRRVLFRKRRYEDALYCVLSAREIRQYITKELTEAQPGKSLENALRAIRAACREFMDAAGPEAQDFNGRHGGSTERFNVALGVLRAHIGQYTALIAGMYDIAVEDDLADIMPPEDDDDPSWIPGFARGGE